MYRSWRKLCWWILSICYFFILQYLFRHLQSNPRQMCIQHWAYCRTWSNNFSSENKIKSHKPKKSVAFWSCKTNEWIVYNSNLSKGNSYVNASISLSPTTDFIRDRVHENKKEQWASPWFLECFIFQFRIPSKSIVLACSYLKLTFYH